MVLKKKSKTNRLLTFKDELGGEEIVINMWRDLEFTDDIDSQINDVVVGFMLSGKLEALAEERFERCKIELDEFKGNLDEQARDYDVIGRPTDARVKAFVERDEEYVKRRKRLTRMRRQWMVLKHFNKAFAMKADLLRTIAANRRKEYDDLGMSPPSVRKSPPKKSKKKDKE